MSRTRRIALATLVAVAVIVAMTWTAHGWNPRSSLAGGAFYFWLALCVGAECLWIRTPSGRSTISMASCAHFAALLVLSRSEAMAVAALASLVAERAVLRKPWIRTIYNAAQVACAVGVSNVAFFALGGSRSHVIQLMASGRYLPFLVAGLIYFTLNHGATTAAVSLDSGRAPWTVWRSDFGTRYEIFSSATLFSLGVLLAMQYQLGGVWGVIPLVLPVVLAKDGYDRFLASLQRSRSGRAPSNPPEERVPSPRESGDEGGGEKSSGEPPASAA